MDAIDMPKPSSRRRRLGNAKEVAFNVSLAQEALSPQKTSSAHSKPFGLAFGRLRHGPLARVLLAGPLIGRGLGHGRRRRLDFFLQSRPLKLAHDEGQRAACEGFATMARVGDVFAAHMVVCPN